MRQIYSLFIISFLLFISSCKKDNTIGADILPQDDLLNVRFSDTFTLTSKTLADTFLRSDKLAKNYLGVINDALFGFQKASIAIEVDKPNTVYDDTLMTTFTVDSVVLFLKYNSIYGDTTVAQSFEVSTISTPINENSAYYSNSGLFPGSGVIGTLSNYTYTPNSNPVSTSTTDSIGTNGILRVRLNSSVGYTIINLGQNVLRDSALFKAAFPGILIENSTNSGKAMAEIDLSSSYSSITIFYKDKYNVVKNMKLYTSLLKNNSGSLTTRVNGVNLFSNTLPSVIQNTISSGLTSDSVNYILGQGGTTVRLSLPTIANLGRVAVNKAVITLTQLEQNSQPEFITPYYLALLKRNASGNLDVLPTNDGIGILDTVAKDDFGNKISRYSFNITKYIQAISVGSVTNSDLYIATYRSAGTDGTINVLNSILNGSVINVGYTPYRVVTAGSNYSDSRYKMKLNLTYTLIK